MSDVHETELTVLKAAVERMRFRSFRPPAWWADLEAVEVAEVPADPAVIEPPFGQR